MSCEFDLNLNLNVFHYKNLGFLINKMAYFQENTPSKHNFLYKYTTIKNICGNFVPIFKD